MRNNFEFPADLERDRSRQRLFCRENNGRRRRNKFLLRISISVSLQNSSNHRNKVLPAVWANGRFKTGSRTPGAWPITIILLTIAPPETGGGIMPGQRRH